jgi:hypothetical protein
MLPTAASSVLLIQHGLPLRAQGGPWVPTGVTLDWAPNPAYARTHGNLPFSDPWWKILALIVALIAAIVAAVAAATGHGTASGGASGTFDETDPSVHCSPLQAFDPRRVS